MFEKLSPKSIKIVMVAQEEARRLLSSFVLPEHILLGILKEGGSIAYKLLNERGINYESVHDEIKNNTENKPQFIRLEMQFSPLTKHAVEMAVDESERLNEELVEPEHLLLGIVNIGEGIVVDTLKEAGINLSRIRWHLLRLRENSETNESEEEVEQNNNIILTTDLTSKVEKKEIEPVIEFSEYIEEIISNLNLYEKHYPIIIGNSGVGKNSLITGLTQYLMEGKIYKELQNFRVLEFSFYRLFYESENNEQIFKNFKQFIDEINNAKDVILIVKDIGFIIQLSNIYNMFIYFLKNTKVNIIAVESIENYNLCLKNQDFKKYFTPIEILESSKEKTVEILGFKARKMSKYYDVNIEAEALIEIVNITKEINPEGFYPGASVKILDVLLSKKKFSKSISQSKIKDIEKNLRALRSKRDEYIANQNYEKLEELKNKAYKYEEEIKQLNVNVSQNIKPTLSVKDVQLILKDRFNEGELS